MLVSYNARESAQYPRQAALPTVQHDIWLHTSPTRWDIAYDEV